MRMRFANFCNSSDPNDRPTAEILLKAPFCQVDPHFNFLDTELYSKIRPDLEESWQANPGVG